MPDLNFHCPAVQDAILEIARFWLERGVDGFRMDTANFYFHNREFPDNPPQPGDSPVMMQAHVHNVCQPENLHFLARLRQVLDAYPGRTSVAEIGSVDNLARMIEYTQGGKHLHTAYSFVLLGDRYDPVFIAGLMEPWQHGAGASAWPSWAFSNHDAPRVASRWIGEQADPARCQQLIALLACLRGTLFIYQGEELGLAQSEIAFENLRDPFGLRGWPQNKGRDGCRTPMPWQAEAHAAGFSTGTPWLPLEEAHRARAVDLQEADPDSTLRFTRRVLALRRAHLALRLGDFQPLHVDAQVLVVSRRHGDDAVLAAFNLGPEPRVVDLSEAAVAVGEALTVADARLEGRRVVLGPWSALIVPVHPSPIGHAP